MIAGGLSMLTLALLMPSSRPMPMGGSVTALVHRSAPMSRSFSPGRGVDLLTAAQVLEPVLAADGGSSLARVVASDPSQIVLALAPGGQRDEQPITAADLVHHLYALARPDSSGAHCVLAIEGALARVAGDPRSALGIEIDDETLRIRLSENYPPTIALLSTLASAAPDQLGPSTADDGSGAFLIPVFPAYRLVPNRRHREGRPLLDELLLQRVQTTFGLRTELRRRAAVVTFGVPGQTGPDATRTMRLPPMGHPATELVFLRAGRRSDLPIDVLHSIGASLPRERLVEREWPGETMPAPSLRLGAESVLVVERKLTAPRSAVLSYLDEEGPGRRLIERLQLDLLRLGVSARLEPLDAAVLEARKKDKNFDLLVEAVTVEGSVLDLELHELHRLLSLGSHFGILPRVVARGDLAAFWAADRDARRTRLEKLERDILRAARVVPLVRRDLETRVSAVVEGVRMRAFGVPDFGNALRTPSESTP